MNVRTRKPAATIERPPAIHGENPSATHAAPISPTYTTTEVNRFEIARPRRGTA